MRMLFAGQVLARAKALLGLKNFNDALDTWTALRSNLITTRTRLAQLDTDVQAGKVTVENLRTAPATADELKSPLAKANRPGNGLQISMRTSNSRARFYAQSKGSPPEGQQSAGAGFQDADLNAGTGVPDCSDAE